MEEADEIVREFLAESSEGLDQFDRDIVALEGDPGSAEHLGSAFRVFHTIKGTSGFLGFPALERLTHGAESMLAKLRDGEIRLNTARTDVLLDVGDSIRSILSVVEQTGQDGGRDVSDLVRRLDALQMETDADRRRHEPAVVGAPYAELAPHSATLPPEPDPPATAQPSADAPAGLSDRAAPPSSPESGNGSGGEAGPGRAETAPRDRAPSRTDDGGTSALAERSIRVDVDVLDSLMRQVGELVLARNEVVSYAEVIDDSAVLQSLQRLSSIVSELQEGVMKTRMQPLTQLFAKIPRIVRDIYTQIGKEVTVDITGGETELDRSVLEAVRDPFTHLIRNAIDHGIEHPDERERLGKPRTGTVSIRAFHEGGQVTMEVADDGRGIDTHRIRDKADAMGLIPAERLASMSDRDLTELIFHPGFSTADKVTTISGRGVGMDVVRANIEAIGGTVDVISHPGHGTTFRIRIPLTLAIVPALLVGCQGQRYAIPQPNLVEMLHIGTQASPAVVETIDQAEVMRLRGELLPLVRLDNVFEMPNGGHTANSRATVAVLQADGIKFGLVIDEVFETQEIVVKPLGFLVNHIGPLAGATILGDGAVSLIIDVVGLATTAGLQDTATRLASAGHELTETPVDERLKSAFIILRVGENRTVAVPVEQVARLESLAISTVEKSGEIDVVQYRGRLMRLVRLHEVLGILGAPATDDEALKVVVHESDRGPIGFVVADLVDVLEDVVDLADIDSGYGLAGAVVLHGRVTDVLDLDAALLWMQREGFFAEAL